jgi:hypothetical protein
MNLKILIENTIKNVKFKVLKFESLNECLYCDECNQNILSEAKLELTDEEIEFEKELKRKLPRLNLLSVLADAKTLKSLHDKRSGDQYITGILYIAPSEEGGVDVCVGSSGCCRIGCLNTAGNPAVLKGKLRSRIRKAQELHLSPELFFTKLKSDIVLLKHFAEEFKLKLAIRMNGTSDYDFGEKMEDFIKEQSGKGVTFYDYTKIVPRYKKYSQSKLIHQTFSRSELNDKAALDILKNGGNVAYVFYQKNNILPTNYLGYKVLNGDASDLRFLDDKEKEFDENGNPIGVIVGLNAKGALRGRGSRYRAIRRSVMWNKKQKNPKYIGSSEFKKDCMDYFGVSSLEDLFNDRDKLKEYLDFQKPDGKLMEPDGGFEIIVDDLKKIRPEVFNPNYKASDVDVNQEIKQLETKQQVVQAENKENTFKNFFTEETKKRDRCLKKADSVYGKKTSAYKSGAVVKCRQGKIWKKKKKK